MEETKKDYWSAELDNYLQSLISHYGTTDWNFIANNLNAAFTSACKTPQSCCKRWYENLEPVDSKTPWTEQEELRMLLIHQKHQNKWSNIAQELNGRSNNSIKNRFYSIFRKVKNKVLKLDVVHESKLELLQTLYMMYLMECYINTPQPIPKQAGKRGKDFIFSLLKGLHSDVILRYKTELQKSDGAEISLDKLWLELVGEIFVKSSDFFKPASIKNNVQIFSYITDPRGDKSLRILPLPRFTQTNNRLTSEEKHFIHFQAFKSKGVCSAGVYCPAMMASTPYFSPIPQSASLIQSALTAPRFEGFSDFTEKTARVYQPHLAHKKESIESEQEIPIENHARSNLFM